MKIPALVIDHAALRRICQTTSAKRVNRNLISAKLPAPYGPAPYGIVDTEQIEHIE